MIYGTSYFVSETSAVSYYQTVYGSRIEAARAVSQKIREGEIHIGKPDLRRGETLSLIDNGTRYAIRAPD